MGDWGRKLMPNFALCGLGKNSYNCRGERDYWASESRSAYNRTPGIH